MRKLVELPSLKKERSADRTKLKRAAQKITEAVELLESSRYYLSAEDFQETVLSSEEVLYTLMDTIEGEGFTTTPKGHEYLGDVLQALSMHSLDFVDAWKEEWKGFLTDPGMSDNPKLDAAYYAKYAAVFDRFKKDFLAIGKDRENEPI